MAINFEALQADLSLRVDGWLNGFKEAGAALPVLTNATEREVAKQSAIVEKGSETWNRVQDAIKGITTAVGGMDLSVAAQDIAWVEKATDALAQSIARAAQEKAELDALLTDSTWTGAAGDMARVKEMEQSIILAGDLARMQEESLRDHSVEAAMLDASNAIYEQRLNLRQQEQRELDDLIATEDQAFRSKSAAMEEELHLTHQIEQSERSIADNYEYEAYLLDELNSKFEEQAALREKAAIYRDLPTTQNRSFLEMTNSEAAAGGGGGVPGMGGMATTALRSVPGGGAFAAGGVAAGAAVITMSLTEFAAAEQAAVRLESVLRATDHAAGLTSEEIGILAENIQRLSKHEDDAVVGAAALVASMKTIKGDNFRDTLLVAADLAEVLETDFPAAAETLARALADPEQGLMRLQRAGIFLTDQQKELIKSFMAVNEVAAAQRVILDEVASRTAGAAADGAKTLGGQFEKLKNDAGNLGETLGGGLAPVFKFLIGLVRGVVFVFQKTADGIGFIVDKVVNFKDSITEVRIEWNEFWGDVEEAESLRKSLSAADAAVPPPIPSPPTSAPKANARPAAGGRSTGGSSGGTSGGGGGGGFGGGSSSEQANFGAFGELRSDGQSVADRLKKAKAEASFHAQFLAQSTPQQASQFVDALNREINDAIKNGGLRYNLAGEIDMKGFDELMGIYKARLEKIPGFNEDVWKKIEAQVQQSLKMATVSQGDMKNFYLTSVNAALQSADTMFTDHQRKLDQAKKDAQVAGPASTAGGKPGGKTPGADPENGDQPIAGSLEQQAAEQVNYYASLAEESANEINARITTVMADFRSANQGMQMFGLGTDEQRAGLVDLQQNWLQAMQAVRDSTGTARAANIEELKKVEAAWAYAQQQIRDGSKKTVEQLVADAAKQGDAAKKAAKETADAGTSQSRARRGGGGGGAQTMDGFSFIGGMSQQFSSMLSGAMAGFGNIGAAAANFGDYVNSLQNPLDQIDALVQNAQARLGTAQINARNFGIGNDGRGIDAIRAELVDLGRRRQAVLNQAAQEREAAEKRRSEEYQQRQMEKEEREREKQKELALDMAAVLSVGKKDAPVMNVYGVHDARELADTLDKEMRRRGHNRGAQRTLDGGTSTTMPLPTRMAGG